MAGTLTRTKKSGAMRARGPGQQEWSCAGDASRWADCLIPTAVNPNAMGTLNQQSVASNVAAMDLGIIVLIVTLTNQAVCDQNHRCKYSGIRSATIAPTVEAGRNLVCACFFAFCSPIMAHGDHTQAARSV